jgi:hypothetical protein
MKVVLVYIAYVTSLLTPRVASCSMLLTKAQLAELSGYQRPSAVRRWLISEGIKFLLGADGWPRVHEQEVERFLVGGRAKRVREPDADGLRRYQSET